ncbi:Nitrilotriacetate monooxygenase component B EC 11413 CDS [Bradyrhizobium sp.]|uniref:flavin reductase family protein n=1 Tax=Bradyrhizobium sp. TaxID=376 RepID=UPI0007C1B869|nr:flavin reductase family protein [Bradyrhizobium sp.]CUU16788.1 Nitrilotriacetate monooxygenase component B EC 11413 CDS [Bradyrhizobium sp.]
MNDLPKQPAISDPANELASDSSPIDPRDFRNALGTYGTGVTIITAMAADGKPYGITCNSFASHFAVHILGTSQQTLANKFAKSSEDKFAGVDWTPGLGNAPVLAESVANFQCRSVNRYYGGDHVIFLGAVEAYAYSAKEPLLFARGGYGRFLADDERKKSP